MIFTRQQVFQVCQEIAQPFGLDPMLIYAICLQEGEKDEATKHYDPSVARLEQGYYRRYSETRSLATTSEILLACSYGVMQTMGGSLYEDEFFEWYYNQQSDGEKRRLQGPYSRDAITAAIDDYCIHLDWQIRFGCIHFKKKLAAVGGDTRKALLRWNGGGNLAYDDEVLAKYERVKSGYR